MTLKSDNGGCVKVYACVDASRRINKVDSGWNIPDFAGWVEIDESGSGSRGGRDSYAHAQKNYFPDGLTNPDDTHRYVYAPDLSPAYREATAEELEAERKEIEAAKVPAGPTAEQLMQQMITDLELQGIGQGQAITDLELQSLEQGQAFTDHDLENIESNQRITDMELSNIENGQKATDLEIKVLELVGSVQRYQSTL